MPIPTPQTKQPPKDAKAYLAQLDELLKRNTGTGTYIGADVSSNTPMYIPGRVSDPTGLGQVAPSIAQYGSGMTPPPPVERQPDAQYTPPQEETPFSGVSDFLQQFSESVYTPQPPSSEELEQLYQGAQIPYGIASQADGSILLNTGETIRPQTTTSKEEAYPIASLQDGSILWSDGFTRQAPSGLTGVQALSQVLFNRQQTVTQDFGNPNAGLYGSGNSHMGTDFRVRDLENQSQTLPTEAKVVQIFRNHPSYGNSVLFQLATGEMMRLSHFDSLGDFQEGQVIDPGTPIGVYGSTGNSTANHLDVELYSSEGQLVGPDQFTAFSNPEVFGGQGNITGVSPYGGQTPASPAPQNQSPAPQPQNQPQLEQQADTRPLAVQGVSNVFNQGKDSIGKAVLGASKAFESGTPEPVYPNQPATSTPELPVPVPTPNIPAPQPSEPKQPSLSSLQGTNPFRQLAGNAVDTLSTPLKKAGLPDLGISEAIAGGKTVNTNANLAPQAGASDGLMSTERKPQDYANVLKGNIQEATAQAGEGLRGLASSGLSAFSNIFKPKQVEAQRVVGDVAGTPGDVAGTSTALSTPNAFSSLMDTASSMQSLGKNDIRDPFFKSGQSSSYQNFLKPNADQLSGGALTLDLFNPEFYQSKENISNVFGGTNMSTEAEGKYSAYQEAERVKQEAEQRAKAEDMKRKPGEIYAEWMKRTGGQSQMDSIRSNPRLNFDENSGNVTQVGQAGHPSSKQGAYNDTGRQMSVGPQQGVTNAIRAASQGQTYVSPSGNKIHNYTPANANMSDASTGLPVYGGPVRSASRPASNNIFSKTKSFLNNIFRR